MPSGPQLNAAQWDESAQELTLTWSEPVDLDMGDPVSMFLRVDNSSFEGFSLIGQPTTAQGIFVPEGDSLEDSGPNVVSYPQATADLIESIATGHAALAVTNFPVTVVP